MAVGLSILRARAAPVAVIFRRGPTKAVRMVRWQMTTDELVHGQWFAGRVYPERCDVSPDGELVVYFAMRRGDTFNAVSRPPYFTPLCVWEEGGTWGGGGAWVTNTELRLRANPAVMQPAAGFTLPAWLELGWLTGGFDRDTWQPLDSGARPFTARKPHPVVTGLELWRRPAPTIYDDNTDRHAFAFQIVDRAQLRDELGTADWADWHPSGDLAIARDGVIQRTATTRRALGATATVADFNADVFEKQAPPAWALAWPAR
ncbi:MAG: hypothetical protein ABI867_38380 [Kofleriaceae bacterium]